MRIGIIDCLPHGEGWGFHTILMCQMNILNELKNAKDTTKDALLHRSQKWKSHHCNTCTLQVAL